MSDEMTFSDDQQQDALRFLAIVKSEAQGASDPIEIYELHHDHDLSEDDCECVQYLTDHLPLWTNGIEA